MYNAVIESANNYSHFKVNGRLLPEGLEMSETYTYIHTGMCIPYYICMHRNLHK